MKILVGLSLGLMATALNTGSVVEVPSAAASVADFGAAELVGNIEKKSLNEASGMAASRYADATLWLINDSGHKPKLFAMSTTGEHRGTVDIDNVRNQDWEDLASFTLDGKNWLLIADTGDNKSRHPFSSLYVVPEPQADADGEYDGAVSLAWNIHFTYEDGPRDVESVAVDVIDEQVLLLSKRTDPPVLYSLPLRPGVSVPQRGPAGVIVARRVGEVTSVPRPSAAEIINDPLHGSYRGQPTGMDITGSGSELAIMTYGDIFRYVRGDAPSWHAALQREPRVLRKPASGQTEAIAYSLDERAIFYTAEERGAPVFRYRRQ